MIYLKGSGSLKEALGAYPLTEDLNGATCVVLELPENRSELAALPEGVPVWVVITGMLSLAEMKEIQAVGAKPVALSQLTAELSQYTESQRNPAVAIFEDDLYLKGPEMAGESSRQLAVGRKTRKNSQCHVAISFSTAGGVGKTFLSLNLAVCTALKGIDAVALDLDLRSSELDFAAGLVDPENRKKVIDKKARVPRDGWMTLANWRGFPRDNLKESILRHSSGLYVVPAYPTINTEIPGHEIEELICTLTESFDLVMIDGGLDFAQPHIRTALTLADTIFLVADQEIKSLGKVREFLALAGPNLKQKSKLVINMVNPQGYFAPDEVASRLQYNEYASIRMDRQGVNTARRSRRATVQMKGSPAGEDVWQIAYQQLPFSFSGANRPDSRASLWGRLKTLLCIWKGKRRIKA